MDKCFYCEYDFGTCYSNSKTPLGKTRDHIIPASKNGNSSQLNLVDACHQCNLLKGAHLPEDFSQILIWRIKQNKLGLRSANCFSIKRLEVVLINNNKLIEIIEPYRHKLFKDFPHKAVSRNKPTVKQRKKIEKIAPFTDNPISHEAFMKRYSEEPQCNFHY